MHIVQVGQQASLTMSFYFLAMGLLAGCNQPSEVKSTPAESPTVIAQPSAKPSLGLANATTSHAQYVLIDVRTAQEYQTDGLPQAINVPYDAIDNSIAKIVQDTSTPIKLYCRSGRRADIAMQMLEQMGYTHVENLGTVAGASRFVSEGE